MQLLAVVWFMFPTEERDKEEETEKEMTGEERRKRQKEKRCSEEVNREGKCQILITVAFITDFDFDFKDATFIRSGGGRADETGIHLDEQAKSWSHITVKASFRLVEEDVPDFHHL